MANLVEIFEKTLSYMLLVLRKHLRSVKNKLAVVSDIWYYDFSECNKQKKRKKKKEINQICYLRKHKKGVDSFILIVQWSFKY